MKVVLLGTKMGSVRMYLWPFDMSLKVQDYFEIGVHQAEVKCLALTSDYQYLASGSSEGDIFFMKIQEFQDGNEVSTFKQYKQRIFD